MGCCTSSPHAKRRYSYRDIADLDEEFVSEDELQFRTFGKYRSNQVWVPDDIDGLPSTRDRDSLVTDPDIVLYEAEADHGKAWRCLKPIWLFVPLWPSTVIITLLSAGLCSFDEICCYVRKEYFIRTYYRVYPNRIEFNHPAVRFPWGCLGCGSWNGDQTITNPFDRGAFGFRRVQFGAVGLLCCCIPSHGDVVGRQRCQCNGPVWNGGWWCDEWICNILGCVYNYNGFADGDEVAFASNLALQAYFEGRKMSKEKMDLCLQFWRQNVSEYHDPVSRKRDVCCEPYYVPCCPQLYIYRLLCQRKRNIPFEEPTEEMEKVYEIYEQQRQRQIERYENFKYPRRQSNLCQALGCRRFWGRKGVVFCTEGCSDNPTTGCCNRRLKKNPEDPFPPAPHRDLDDIYDAAQVLQIVLGSPPRDVVYKRWEMEPATGEYVVVIEQADIEAPEGLDALAEEVTIPSFVDNTSNDQIELTVSHPIPIKRQNGISSSEPIHQNGSSQPANGNPTGKSLFSANF